MREDSDVIVFAEHPDHIRLRDLSDCLVASYGQDEFKIWFGRNIYVIYVNRGVAGDDYVSKTHKAREQCISNGKIQNSSPVIDRKRPKKDVQEPEIQKYRQWLSDTKLAERVLRDAKLPKSQE